MAAEWPEVALSHICDHSAFGPRFSGELYSRDGNVATLRTTDISEDGRIEYATMPRAHLDSSRFRQHFLQKDDLVVTRSGRVGTTAVFGGFCLPVLPGAFLIRFRLKRDIADPQFYRYYFSSDLGRRLIQSVATGSVQQNLNITSLHGLRIPLPPLSEQRAIAQILGTLDKKIELNRRMNEMLEAIARAIFKSWFVDFDPVRAKAEGRQPFGMDAETSALFPDSFEDSVFFGKIPSSWRVGKIADLVSLARQIVNPPNFPDEPFDHYSIPAFDEGRWPKEEIGQQIKSNKFLIPKGAVLLSKLNPRLPRTWMPELNGTGRSIASTEFLVAMPQNGFSRDYVYALFTSQGFLSVFETLVTGTSGSHQRVKPEFLLALDAIIPPQQCVDSFSRAVAPLYARAFSNLSESRTLSAIRDALLPKLTSGQIRLKRPQ